MKHLFRDSTERATKRIRRDDAIADTASTSDAKWLIADSLDEALAKLDAVREYLGTLDAEDMLGYDASDFDAQFELARKRLIEQAGNEVREWLPEFIGPLVIKNQTRIHAHWKLRQVGSERAQLLGTVDGKTMIRDAVYLRNEVVRERECQAADLAAERRDRNRKRNQRRKRAKQW